MRKDHLEQEPTIKTKDFTLEEIDLGIKKLERRIVDVQGLIEKDAYFDDEVVNSVELSIRSTIREIFGAQSAEFDAYKHYRIRHGTYNVGSDSAERQLQFAAGIPQTIAMLEGLISSLSEKMSDLLASQKSRTRALFQGMEIHTRIIEVCKDLYKDGHYTSAVFEASKALINYVKERSGRHELDGAPLMRTVFSKNNPVLAFNDQKDQYDLDEQEGMMHLFEGAVLAIRNPRGHTFLDDSPERALEYIGLLSFLSNRLEEARRCNR